MKPETQQQKLLTTLHEAARQRKRETFCYKSEWLGDLPFDQYHWLEMAGADLVADSPDSLREDLAILEQAGAIIEVQRREIDADTLHISYAFSGENPDRTLNQGDQNNQQQQAEGNQKSKLSWLAYLVGALLLLSVPGLWLRDADSAPAGLSRWPYYPVSCCSTGPSSACPGPSLPYSDSFLSISASTSGSEGC